MILLNFLLSYKGHYMDKMMELWINNDIGHPIKPHFLLKFSYPVSGNEMWF